MQTNLLKSKITLHGETQTVLAEALGITTRALNYKVNGVCQFKADEIKIIKERYALSDTDVAKIFFE